MKSAAAVALLAFTLSGTSAHAWNWGRKQQTQTKPAPGANPITLPTLQGKQLPVTSQAAMRAAALSYLKSNRAGPVRVGGTEVVAVGDEIHVTALDGHLQARRVFRVPAAFDRNRQPASALVLSESLFVDLQKQRVEFQRDPADPSRGSALRMKIFEGQSPEGRHRASVLLWKDKSPKAKPEKLVFEVHSSGMKIYERNLTNNMAYTRQRSENRDPIKPLTDLRSASEHVDDIMGDLYKLRPGN